MKDVDFRLQPGIDSETTIRSAWIMMREQDIETLCIIDKEKNLKGLITMADIANANMAIFDTEIQNDSNANDLRTLLFGTYRFLLYLCTQI